MESNDEDKGMNSQHDKQPQIYVAVSLPALTLVPTETVHNRECHSNLENNENEIENQFRRSSSLRIQKNCESSTTLAQKKMVRFADVLGLDLASVRMFLDELPEISGATMTAGVTASKFSHKEDAAAGSSVTSTLVPTFESPAELADFPNRVRSRRVCLETARVGETPVHHIAGRIKVANLDFCKSVYVRYTSDEWKTYAEVQAKYVPPEANADEVDQSYDKFAFVIYVYDTFSVGHRIEFAIRYQCRDSVYWDNNDGKNYAFQRTVGASASPIPSTDFSSSSLPSCIDNFHHPFY